MLSWCVVAIRLFQLVQLFQKFKRQKLRDLPGVKVIVADKQQGLVAVWQIGSPTHALGIVQPEQRGEVNEA